MISVYVATHVPCTQPDYDILNSAANTGNSPPSSAANQPSPYLIVSNSPETMTPGTGTKTLYKCEIPLTSGTKRIRVYFWHVSTKTGTTYFNVLASLSSGTGTVSDRRIDEPATGTEVDKGVCISKVHLFDSWNTATSNVPLTTAEASIWSKSKTQNQLAAMVMEFDVTVESSINLQIRTTASASSGVQGAWGDSVEALDTHVRGWWPYSSLELDCGSWNARPPMGPHILTIGVCEAAGPEHGSNGFAKQSTGDPHGTKNLGCYGVDLTYKVAISNTGTQSYPLFVYGVARNIGGLAAGAANVESPSGFPQFGFNYLLVNSTHHSGFFRLTSDSAGNEAAISVATSANYDLRVIVANAGGAGTPFDIVLSGLAIAPVEEPG